MQDAAERHSDIGQNKKHPKALFVFDKENKSFKLYPNLGTILANG